MSEQTIVLVTGSKTGIGRGILAAYAQRANTIAIAAIRDGPDSTPAKDLASLPTGTGSKVIVAKYDAGSTTAAAELTTYLREKHHIQHLDVVIANAGILKHFGPAKNVTAEELQEHLLINTIAPILLYQATTMLLNQSPKEPKFFIISSNMGSNTLMDNYPMPMIAYSLSKAAVNYAAGRIHREEERIVVMPLQPGWVQTAMGERAASFAGKDPKDVPVTQKASVRGLMKVFDSATKAESSGKFWDQNGQLVPW
jgi:norsolorinic acid ketoreductase